MLSRKSWVIHPLSIFIFSILALVSSLYIYIHWYFKLYQNVETLVRKFNLDPLIIDSKETWFVIIILAILITCIIAGMAIIFIYYSKWVKLYRKQQNFFNGFTHELKTPIASLKLFVETLKKRDLSKEKQAEYLEYMSKDIDRLSSNVERILNFSKLDEMKKISEVKKINLRYALEETLSKNSSLLDHAKIDLINGSDHDVFLHMNISLFDIMISNLLSNSIFHNDKEEVQIKITYEKLGNKIQLTFQDNGNGLKKNELKDIFQKFHQGKNSAKGSGLGLYLVKVIAKLHKGKVIARSRGEGMGSEFVLTFPDKEKGGSQYV